MAEYEVELLAPAGSKDAFLGAIHAGADAVYLAGNKYGARAYADNFSEEELVWCIRYAHIWGRKVYLTVNTLMKDEELETLYEYILPFYEAGLDACIVQDLGAFACLKRWFPEMELHVSTQMTITGAYGAAFLKELGASRIVPARELSLAEIRKMKEETGLELETFIHGAMCYCYSGQCLFSSILGGRSGNRGRCAQPCRLPYQVDVGKRGDKEYYPLSLKDMCTIEHIEALMDAGIDSFKIEGRMKKPEYAAGVTAIYRKYIDLKKKNPKRKLEFQKKDLEQLSKIYIRSERQDGYYFKQNGGDMVTLESPAYSGSDEALLAEIRQKYVEARPKKPVTIDVSIQKGQKAWMMMTCEYLCAIAECDVVEQAQNTPLSKESIEKQMRKLGDTCFEIESLNVETDGESFYSVKGLNELRREAVRVLENMLIEAHGLCAGRETGIDNAQASDGEAFAPQYPNADLCIEQNKLQGIEMSTMQVTEKNTGWTILLSTKDQLRAYEQYLSYGKLHFERVYIESELFLNNTEFSPILCNQRLYIALPYCMRAKDEADIQRLVAMGAERGIQGFLVRNIEEYAFLRKSGYTGEIHGDAGLYIWNREALAFWRSRLNTIHCPLELNRKEWYALFKGWSFEKMVYGRIPMMVTANCVAKTADKCRHGREASVVELTDRYKKHFPVVLNCAYCMNIIYNSVPLSLHKDIVEGRAEYEKKLLFTVESEAETKAVLAFFEKVSAKESATPPFKEYTTAHEKRGVE